MRRAVFAGTFDPITIGHENLVSRALSFFDEVIVAIGENPDKKTFFPIEKRLLFLKTVFDAIKGVRIETYKGLTGDFARMQGAGFLLRGVRSVADFEYESALAEVNKTLFPELETVMLFSTSAFMRVSSSVVREVLQNQADLSAWVPKKIIPLL